MFRAAMCPSSGELIVSIWHLVYVILCRWPFGVQVWMRLMSRIEINIHGKDFCVKLVIYKDYTEMHEQENIKYFTSILNIMSQPSSSCFTTRPHPSLWSTVYRKLARSRHFTHTLSSALSVILLFDTVYKHVVEWQRGQINSKISSEGGGGGGGGGGGSGGSSGGKFGGGRGGDRDMVIKIIYISQISSCFFPSH